jgi:Flp pilus assembly protein TadG
MNCARPRSLVARRIRRDERGSVLVEFALLAPVFITMLIGAVQVGLQIQNTNAVRNLASDGARFAVVQYQLNRESSIDTLETWIRSRGVGYKYNLNTDRLTIAVTQATTSRITGTKEMQIQITYDAPDYLVMLPGDMFQLSYTRPVFLLQAAAPST